VSPAKAIPTQRGTIASKRVIVVLNIAASLSMK